MDKIKTISAVLVFMTALVTAVIAVDTRYALAADLEETKSELAKARQMNQQLLQTELDTYRQKQLEDIIFDIRIKEEKTKVDEARLQRYESELMDIKNRKLLPLILTPTE